jgi:hypothetical protein
MHAAKKGTDLCVCVDANLCRPGVRANSFPKQVTSTEDELSTWTEERGNWRNVASGNWSWAGVDANLPMPLRMWKKMSRKLRSTETDVCVWG